MSKDKIDLIKKNNVSFCVIDDYKIPWCPNGFFKDLVQTNMWENETFDILDYYSDINTSALITRFRSDLPAFRSSILAFSTIFIELFTLTGITIFLAIYNFKVFLVVFFLVLSFSTLFFLFFKVQIYQ